MSSTVRHANESELTGPAIELKPLTEEPNAKFVKSLPQRLPPFPRAQYHDRHELFRDDLPVLPGPRHLWAQETSGDRAPSRQIPERIQACLQRIQGADRAGDRSPRSGEPAADHPAAQPTGGRSHEPKPEIRSGR